jgi:hypothetical protein
MRCPGKMDRRTDSPRWRPALCAAQGRWTGRWTDRQTDSPRWCPALCAAQGRWTGRWTDRQTHRDGARLYALPREDAFLERLDLFQRPQRGPHQIRHGLRPPPVVPVLRGDPGRGRKSATNGNKWEDGQTGRHAGRQIHRWTCILIAKYGIRKEQMYRYTYSSHVYLSL